MKKHFLKMFFPLLTIASLHASNTDENTYTEKHHTGEKQVIFSANTSECRIGLNDRSLLLTGDYDFVTAFNGNDFRCSTVKLKKNHHCEKKALKIKPLYGKKFTYGVPTPPVNGPVVNGLFDHVKFLAYSIDVNTPLNGTLCSKWKASAKQLNVKHHPFGSAVKNPNEDPRLACVGLTSLEPNQLVTNDWIITNDVIYALTERLPILGTDYAAYTYLVPVYKRKDCQDPLNDFHTFETCYNASTNTMTWVLDYHPVFSVTEFGVRLNESNAFIYKDGERVALSNPSRFKILDHGGVDTPTTLGTIQTGISFFSLLDAYRPNNKKGTSNSNTQALVRLESSEERAPGIFFYYNPLTYVNDQSSQATFVKDSFLLGPYASKNDTERFFHYNPLTYVNSQSLQAKIVQDNALTGNNYASTICWKYRLFGQGAELILKSYKVYID